MPAFAVRRRLATLSLAGLLLLAACAETPTVTPILPATAPPQPTATSAAAAVNTPPPATATAVPPTPTAGPPATDTPLPPPSDTPVPPPTDTAVPPPTDTAVPPKDTPVPPPTVTPLPGVTATEVPAPSPTAAGTGPWQLVAGGIADPRAALVAVADGTLYAGGPGVSRSTDGGRTWTSLTTAFPVLDIAVSPSDPHVIYAGRGEGCASGIEGRLYRSGDAGATWQPVTGGPYQLHVDAHDPNRLLALRCGGVYRSTDGAATWEKLPGTGSKVGDALLLTQGVNNPATLYAVYVSEGGTPTLARSTDTGATWRALPAGNQQGPVAFVVDPLDARHVYFLGAAGFLSSGDGGQSWNPHNKGLEHVDYGFGLSTLALDTVSTPPKGATATLYAASGRPGHLFRWNGADAWVPVAAAPAGQPITRLLAVPDRAAPALLAVTSGGLYRMPLR